MSNFLASLDVRGLTSERKYVRDLQRLRVDICVVQESCFHSDDLDDKLSKSFDLFSVYYNGRSKGVSWLVNHSMSTVSQI